MEYKNTSEAPKSQSHGHTESEIVDYRRIFYGEIAGDTNVNDVNNSNDIIDGNRSGGVRKDREKLKREREKRFVSVFLVQLAVCITVVAAALVLRHAQPEIFENVSSVLNGFYENNITLYDLNRLLDDRIANNDALAAFFNFAPNGQGTGTAETEKTEEPAAAYDYGEDDNEDDGHDRYDEY